MHDHYFTDVLVGIHEVDYLRSSHGSGDVARKSVHPVDRIRSMPAQRCQAKPRILFGSKPVLLGLTELVSLLFHHLRQRLA